MSTCLQGAEDRYVHVMESSSFLGRFRQREGRPSGSILRQEHCRVAGTMLPNRRFLARDVLFSLGT